ncbi:integration host factor alpha subunit [Marinomonas sp. MED121]|nr:integration host factor alpha subunit [Marinomonas sp. MED121]
MPAPLKVVVKSNIGNAGIAQLVEHLTCNQGVPSSTLGAGTINRRN